MIAVIPLALLLGVLTAATGRQAPDDAVAIKTAVDRFFDTQQREDVDAYLAQWSTSAKRPQRESLQYVFDSGQDQFSDITVLRTTFDGDRARVRVSAIRERSITLRSGGRSPVMRTTMNVALTFVREGGEWKLVREGTATDDLAARLLEASGDTERDAVLASDADLVGDALVTSLSRRGAEAAQIQAFAPARRAFETALFVARRAGDAKGEGEVLQNLANTFYFQRDYARALELYESRLKVEQDRKDAEGTAAALAGIATIRYTYAEYAAALASYREALAIQETLDDASAVATTLISTGNVLFLQGDYPSAIADYRRSRELFKRASNTSGEAGALAGLGRALVAQGDLGSALDAFAGVLVEARATGDRARQGTTLMDVGDVHTRLGNIVAARVALEESHGHFEATGDTSHVGRVWASLALVELIASRVQQAEQAYTRSIETCGTAQDTGCVASATVGLGFAQYAQEKYADAVTTYRKSVDAFTALGYREQAARAEVGLSQALTGNGKIEDAIASAGRARDAATGIGNDDVLWRALVAEARAHRRVAAFDRARSAAHAAVDAVERLDERARTRPGTIVARDTSAAYVMLALLQAEAGDGGAALATAERMHVHDLRVVLAPNEREISRGMSEEDRGEERTAATGIVSLQAQLTRERALPKPDAQRLSSLEQRLTAAVAARAAQQDRLYERLPDLKYWRGLLTPVTTSALNDVLADSVLLELLVDDDALVMIGAWREDEGVKAVARVAPLSRRALAEVVATMTQPAVLKDSIAWRKTSLAIADLLPEDVVQHAVASRRFIVVPHDVLWRVPYEALPVGGGYLGDRVQVVYAGSATALLRPGKAVASGSALVAVSAPELSVAQRERSARTAPSWSPRTPDSAVGEVEAIAEGDEEAVRLAGGAASEMAVRQQLTTASLVHIAAPFRLNAASPLFSPIQLAAGSSSDARAEDDGTLDLRELMNLESTARSVILSDGTAFSMRDSAGDAPFVQWAWASAGVPYVSVPRWQVDDPVNGRLLTEVYGRLRKGQDLASAMTAAQAAVRDTSALRAPFYWAGWVTFAAR